MPDEQRRSVKFRCTDEAYQRLFRRQTPERGVPPAEGGQRFDHVLGAFLDAVEQEHGITLLQPPLESGEDSEELRVRQLLIAAPLKRRFEALAARVAAPREALFREAIFRFTGMY